MSHTRQSVYHSGRPFRWGITGVNSSSQQRNQLFGQPRRRYFTTNWTTEPLSRWTRSGWKERAIDIPGSSTTTKTRSPASIFIARQRGSTICHFEIDMPWVSAAQKKQRDKGTPRWVPPPNNVGARDTGQQQLFREVTSGGSQFGSQCLSR